MPRLRDNNWPMQLGAKIYPSDMAGMVGLPKVGNIFYVEPGAGNDGRDGLTWETALDTVSQAVTLMTADQDDVVIVSGGATSTGRTSEASVAWSKRRTHLVGNGPARSINPRNGIGASTADTTPFMTISAVDCSFTNISIAAFVDLNVLVEVTVDYNTFNFVHFQGIGDATAGDDTAARSLLLTAAGETEIRNSTIGLDTVTRSAANSNLEITGSSARNKFIHCYFPAFCDAATPTWVKADTGNCNERFLTFEDCLFTNATQGSSTAMTVGMDVSATGNGQIYMINSHWYGATDLANTVTDVFGNAPVQDTNDQGVLVVHANS